jgi:drug/metabolite transporter (DMT)-like permease
LVNGVVLGVATAVSWGSADFLARFATRTLGSLRAVFWMQSWGAIFATILLAFSGEGQRLLGGWGWRPWAWGIFAGILNTFAMLALYRAFEIGKLSLVGPVSASYPALTVALSLLSGEHLSALRFTGIIAALGGVLLVAAGEKPPAQPAQKGKARSSSASGTASVAWAVAAALSFGVLFYLLGTRIIPQTGAISAVWLIRVTGTLLTLVLMVRARLPLRIQKRQTLGQVYGMGFFDTAAFALNNLGMRVEQIAVMTLLSSLYGAVTVVLATIFLRERVVALQWAGVIAIFCGVALIHL